MTTPAAAEHIDTGALSAPASLSDTVVVLVHYRNYELIGPTARTLLAQGFDPSQILVVDNSEQAEKRARLIEVLPAGVKIVFVPNRGYGNAVNVGISYWATDITRSVPTYVLVATHEVLPRPGAVDKLRTALNSDLQAAAAGPTLISGENEPYIWSAGGQLTKRLGIPRHFDHRAELDVARLASEPIAKREWLDGAFVMYRWGAVQDNPFDEAYFMYMEETDLHLRLRRRGSTVLWVPSAIVWQSSGGIPAYYLSRNLRLLYSRTGRRAQGAVAVPLDVGRRALSDIVKRRAGKDTLDLIRGFLVRLPRTATAATQRKRVTVINPLGGALRHYETELTSTLGEADAEVSKVLAFPEPSVSGKHRIQWIVAYVGALRTARQQRRSSDGESLLLITWPVIGYLDAILICLFYRRPAWIVMHDPDPLVRAVGYGKESLFIGRLLRRYLRVIVHSTAALAVVERQAAYGSVALLPHPMLPFDKTPKSSADESAAKPLVRVLGQFKPDRDLDALRAISARIGDSVSLEIFGRGWPDVAGWSVTEGFLSESEMTTKLAESDVIVVPYARFFQSGVAIRALESGVAVVGPKVPSLVDLFGIDSKLLVDAFTSTGTGYAWAEAIEWAVVHGRAAAAAAADRVHHATVDSWASWEVSSDKGDPS